ncbi:FtsW/RodA/SpoVE family cell cycle protein [Brevibacillus ginsengisoli]|uniref:FtsW/RodA/SpoVE family cell cycle protein n=1 Tax=Brevibacillus ginsengisoli TaxID=363854 RepID=UPI003CE9AC4F
MEKIEKKNPAILYLVLCGLVFYSLAAVSTATKSSPVSVLTYKQTVWVGIGFVAMMVISRMDYRIWAKKAFWLYGFGILAVCSVFVFGKKINGALSWIDLGVLSIQPSELTKITTLIMLARIYELHDGVFYRSEQLILVGGIIALPTLLVLIQPDLGMALVYLSLLGCFMLVTRIPGWVHLALVTAVLGLILGLFSLYSFSEKLFYQVIRPHQFERLTSFLHPEDDPLESGYQYILAKKIVGSGQLGGMGILQLLNSSHEKLPEQHTDFIFAVIAHQWGFAGASALLILYFLLFTQLVHWAMNTPDLFASFFISGMVTMWSFQIFVNIGMNIGLSPITGLTLPFISYGGSSFITNLMACGFLLSMHTPSPTRQLEK